MQKHIEEGLVSQPDSNKEISYLQVVFMISFCDVLNWETWSSPVPSAYKLTYSIYWESEEYWGFSEVKEVEANARTIDGN